MPASATEWRKDFGSRTILKNPSPPDKTEVSARQRAAVGGSSAERGLDYQARVTAIVMTHLLSERPMGWLEGIVVDQPRAVDCETGGGGDDIGFICSGGEYVEIQAKRGLKVSPDLWDALGKLASGIHAREIDAGVLVVCPNSSGTVKSILADDIVRLGTGRTDGLRDVGREFVELLNEKALPVDRVCRAIRIATISAVDGNNEAERAAREQLTRVVEDADAAWPTLVAYGRKLIQIRGRTTAPAIVREMEVRGRRLIEYSTDIPIQIQLFLRRWLTTKLTHVPVLGLQAPISFEACWIPLKAAIVDGEASEPDDLESALKRYHDYTGRRRSDEHAIDAHTIGRYVRRAVILGGPGIGKSTLLKKLALEYSKDCSLVMLASLPRVAALIARGERFEDALVAVGSSGSGINRKPLPLYDAVILCDGLDECGSLQSVMTAELHAFAIAHPDARVLVTTRPIGYQPGLLGDWRHYELQPLENSEAEAAIAKVLEAIPFPSGVQRERAKALAMEQLNAQHLKGVAARSPLMLTMIAALASRGIEPGGGRAALYRQLFRLIEEHSPTRETHQPPSAGERGRYLEMLGWAQLEFGNESVDKVQERCAQWLSTETGAGSLEALTTIQNCQQYWEGRGVIERVRTSSQEALTFVHKTFAEYTAALFLRRCIEQKQRDLIAQAIRNPAWREVLSFASHLGLAAIILDVWSDMADAGDVTATKSLDAAVELVVLSGVPVAAEVLDVFVECCWKVTADSLSRARHSAGEALSVVAQSSWQVLRESALARLRSTDNWERLVAWACLVVSPEDQIPYEEMIQVLRELNELWPRRSINLTMWDRYSMGGRVRQALMVGIAKRVLGRVPLDVGAEVLHAFLLTDDQLSVDTRAKINDLYQAAGRSLPEEFSHYGFRLNDMLSAQGDQEKEFDELLATIDDPEILTDVESVADSNLLEVGAFLTITRFLQMPARAIANFECEGAVRERRRQILIFMARAANVDCHRLIAQVRELRRRLAEDKSSLWGIVSSVPAVDVDPEFDKLQIDVSELPMLELVLLEDGEYFGYCAAEVIHVLRKEPEYLGVIERLIEGGAGIALYYAAVLSRALPVEDTQPLVLRRLETSPLTAGCRHLYEALRGPFGVEHEKAILRGLSGSNALVAVTAAKLAVCLPATPILVAELRRLFEEWKVKEEPYPSKGGVVPQSPRDELAALFARVRSADVELMFDMAADTRPDVRKAAMAPLLAAARESGQVREKLLSGVAHGRLDSSLLDKAINAGCFPSEEGSAVAALLGSASAKVRFAARGILNTGLLPAELLIREAERLLLDPEIEIREFARGVLIRLPSKVNSNGSAPNSESRAPNAKQVS